MLQSTVYSWHLHTIVAFYLTNDVLYGSHGDTDIWRSLVGFPSFFSFCEQTATVTYNGQRLLRTVERQRTSCDFFQDLLLAYVMRKWYVGSVWTILSQRSSNELNRCAFPFPPSLSLPPSIQSASHSSLGKINIRALGLHCVRYTSHVMCTCPILEIGWKGICFYNFDRSTQIQRSRPRPIQAAK